MLAQSLFRAQPEAQVRYYLATRWQPTCNTTLTTVPSMNTRLEPRIAATRIQKPGAGKCDYMLHYLPYGGGNRRAAPGARAAVDARDPQPELSESPPKLPNPPQRSPFCLHAFPPAKRGYPGRCRSLSNPANDLRFANIGYCWVSEALAGIRKYSRRRRKGMHAIRRCLSGFRLAFAAKSASLLGF